MQCVVSSIQYDYIRKKDIGSVSVRAGTSVILAVRLMASRRGRTREAIAMQTSIQPLSWSGYSQRERVTIFSIAENLCAPHAHYAQIPLCADSYQLVAAMDHEERLSLQHRLLDAIDHSTNLTPYMGTMEQARAQELQTQLRYCTLAMVQLLKILVKENTDGADFRKLCDSMPGRVSERFRSAVKTSLHNYTQLNGAEAYEKILQQPLYLELGIDIMMGGLQMMLAEFQVRFSAPYPHFLRNLNQTFSANFPELFQKLRLKEDAFPERRGAMLEQAYQMFASRQKIVPRKIVIDGWGYLENYGANWKQLAHELEADYLLFDDLHVDNSRAVPGSDPTLNYPEEEPLFVFSQAPVYQLDPQDPFYSALNDERMEHYDELAWPGMNRRYLDGNTFFAHAPITDIVNDKALYEFLPHLCKYFFDVELAIPVVDSMQCWSAENPKQVNERSIAWALQNKDDCVFAHRYLEGGSGIRVGASTSQDDWENFIGNYVVERPYLFGLRKYFPMSPDLSMRVLTASLSGSMDQNAPVDFICADSFLARYSIQKPLTLSNSRCMIVFQKQTE
jgi:hypothetical protein